MADRNGTRRLVTAADPAARALGIRPGVTVALAQAMTPGLTVVDADPQGDDASLERLAAWALRYSPVVAADPPGGLVIDITGAAHLQGGEARLLAGLTERLERSGITAQAAIADSWSAAWGLARFAPGTIAAPGGTTRAVATLPVAALRLPADTIAALQGLGLDTISELAAAPRASLVLRFGSALSTCLDRVFGRVPEIIEPVLPPAIPHARSSFLEPLVQVDGLALALDRLAHELCRDLHRAGLGARQLDLRLRRVDHQLAVLRVGTAGAVSDPVHLIRLFAPKLATIQAGFGIEAALLAAIRVEPRAHRQLHLQPDSADVLPDLGRMLDQITARIDGVQVYRLAPVESDVPERSLRIIPPLAPPTGQSWQVGPRPQRLFDPPEPVEVVALMPDHPPALFIWNGRRHRVRAADGPACIFGEWWRSGGEVFHSRDYFRVEDEDGQRVWLFRAIAPDRMRWFIQGVFA